MQGIRYRKLQAVCLAARLLPIIDNFTIGGGGPADPLPPLPPRVPMLFLIWLLVYILSIIPSVPYYIVLVV